MQVEQNAAKHVLDGDGGHERLAMHATSGITQSTTPTTAGHRTHLLHTPLLANQLLM